MALVSPGGLGAAARRRVQVASRGVRLNLSTAPRAQRPRASLPGVTSIQFPPRVNSDRSVDRRNPDARVPPTIPGAVPPAPPRAISAVPVAGPEPATVSVPVAEPVVVVATPVMPAVMAPIVPAVVVAP